MTYLIGFCVGILLTTLALYVAGYVVYRVLADLLRAIAWGPRRRE